VQPFRLGRTSQWREDRDRWVLPIGGGDALSARQDHGLVSGATAAIVYLTTGVATRCRAFLDEKHVRTFSISQPERIPANALLI
jgi:hypothetical protein